MSRRLVVAGVLLLPALFMVRASACPLPGATPLRIATWNMEWLLDPRTLREARIACRDGVASALPCDVARELARDSADLAVLARYARRLDADVIAFQEVQDEAIARRIFRGYRICLHSGEGVQNVGFAVRPGLASDCGRPLLSLSIGGRVRPGLQLGVVARGVGRIELLAVHLKSGCAHDPLDSDREACRLLQTQARVLGDWIRGQSRRGTAFIVLGDFNRGGVADAADAFWSWLHPEAFVDSAQRLAFANCTWGAPYRDFIDHILVSRPLAAALAERPFFQLRFRPGDTARHILSDHCPLRVSLNAPANL